MTLTIDSIIQAVLSAHDLETLQADLRKCMIDHLMIGSLIAVSPEVDGVVDGKGRALRPF